MTDVALPVLFCLFVWWVSTGAVLYMVGLSGERSIGAFVAAAFLLAASLIVLAASGHDTSVAGAYVAFTAAIGVWGAQEIAFLTGWITGSWRRPCPEGARSWARAGFALRAIIHHELALLGSGLAVAAVTWDAPNQTGTWTFAVLFAMRVSAKLNVFLGVPNLTENFLPGHLAHLKSFFARKPMNLLFPASVTASTVALIMLVQAASVAGPAEAASLGLLATLVALGLLEHWFLVLPLPVEALWSWGLVSRPETAVRASATTGPGAIRQHDFPSSVVSVSSAGPVVCDPQAVPARLERRQGETRP